MESGSKHTDPDPLLRELERARAEEQHRQEKLALERNRRRELLEALYGVSGFTGPDDMVQFSKGWAPLWLRFGELIRDRPELHPDALVLPSFPEYGFAARLLEDAIAGVPIEVFEDRLLSTIRLLEKDGRHRALRNIWDPIHRLLEGGGRPDSPSLDLEQLKLSPTDCLILRDLARTPREFKTTRAIAESNEWNPKSIGKNLVRLRALGLLEGLPRKGYLLTWKGRQTAAAISLISPKPKS